MSFVSSMTWSSEINWKRCSARDASYNLAPILIWSMFPSLTCVCAKSKEYVAGPHVNTTFSHFWKKTFRPDPIYILEIYISRTLCIILQQFILHIYFLNMILKILYIFIYMYFNIYIYIHITIFDTIYDFWQNLEI